MIRRASGRTRALVAALFADPRGRHGFSPLVLGTAGIVVVALGLLAAVALPRGWYLARTDAYTAQFANAAGLTTADPVYLSGVPAGRVESVELAGDHVDVHFRLDRRQRLGDRTTASVKLQTILGKRYLAVDPAGAGGVGPGDTIPLVRTSVPFTLDDIAAGAQHDAQQVDTKTLSEMVRTLSQTLPTDSGQVGRALTGVSAAASALTRNSDQITTLLQTSKSLSGLVAGQSTELQALLQNSRTVLDALASRRQELTQLVRDLTTLTDQASTFLGDKGGDVDQLLVNLRSVTQTLAGNAANIDTLLTKLPPALRAATDASGNGNWVDVSAPSAMIPDDLLCQLQVMKGCK